MNVRSPASSQAAETAAANGAPGALSGEKTFVLDTNVLLHNPHSLFMFADNEVVIPFAVLEELDRFKKESDDVGRNARETIRQLDRLRAKGPLKEGVICNEKGGRIRVVFSDDERPAWLTGDGNDNRILAVAWAIQERGRSTVFISKDINVRLKSDAMGIPTEDVKAERVNVDEMRRGYADVEVQGELIDELYREKQLDMEQLHPHLDVETEEGSYTRTIHANDFVQLRNAVDDSQTGLARRLADTDHLIPIHGPRKPVFGLLPRNVQQTMALDLLLDDDIKLVTLLGPAGTGKTLLALAAGMSRVIQEQRYDKLLVARPIQPMGRDIGYLPGSKEEKLEAWMQPIFDNLTYLLAARGTTGQHAESRPVEGQLEQLRASGQLVLEPLTYIRGRSVPNQLMIVDEAQNLTPHEVKTIVSRVGNGTKMVLTGDVGQIDNPYLDSSSNGLSFTVERLKGEALVGHVTLERSERSELASLAAEKL